MRLKPNDAASTATESGRARLAYVMSRFPKISETFVLREMLELVRQGERLVILPLLRVREPIEHCDAAQLMDSVIYTPFFSREIAVANLRQMLQAPWRYLRLLWTLVRESWTDANLLLGGLAIFPKSVFLADTARRLGVRHVHAHFATHPALAALVISELAEVTFSFTAHAHDIFVHHAMLAEKVRRARLIVTVSEFNRRFLLERFPNTPPEKISVIRCGVDPQLYRKCSSTGFTVTTVASLQRYKGIEHAIRACARLRDEITDLRWVVIGEGDQRRTLQALIDELEIGDRICLRGNLTEERVAAELAQSDLFALPSVVAPNGQMEGIPVALMEAMASGLPVVASRLSGIPELVEHGASGLLIEPGNDEALAGAILELQRDPERRKSFGRRGGERIAEEFVLADNVARLRSLFETLDDAQPVMR